MSQNWARSRLSSRRRKSKARPGWSNVDDGSVDPTRPYRIFGRDDAVTLLIDHGAPLDAHSTNALRNSPLHAALAANTLPVLVRRLVFVGAESGIHP